jgi:hypothetical protein
VWRGRSIVLVVIVVEVGGSSVASVDMVVDVGDCSEFQSEHGKVLGLDVVVEHNS